MKYLLTGSSGYVGSQIKSYLEKQGHEVKELRRTPPGNGTPDFVKFKLGEEINPESLRCGEVLVHCAYDFSPRSWDELSDINVEGTRKLFCAATKADVTRIILISSISAFEGCKSLYGRAKLGCEKVAKEFGGVIIRPGLVYGDTPGGMVGNLRRSVQGAAVPVIGGSQHMYLVHESDLAKLVEVASVPGKVQVGVPLMAANESSVTFGTILRTLAHECGVKPFFVSIPWQIVWAALKFAEKIGVKLSMRSDSVISLMNPDPSPPFAETKRSGVEFKPFNPIKE